MKFPNFVYKCPGDHQCKGGTYRYERVTNDDELADMLAAGWSETLAEAMNGKAEKPAPTSPTRAKLEADAKSLDVAFNKRTPDDVLIARINEALGN